MISKFFIVAAIFLISEIVNVNSCCRNYISDTAITSENENIYETEYYSETQTDSKSVSIVTTSSGEDIFDIFNKYNRRQLCSFFQKKGLNDLEQLYISYIKNNDDESRCAFQNGLYQYYSYNNCIDNDILELGKLSSSKLGMSGKLSLKKKLKEKLLNRTSESNSSDSDENCRLNNIVKTKKGKDIFRILQKYSKDQLCLFYKKKGMNDVEKLYLDYVQNNSDSAKLIAYRRALYKYYTQNKCIDTDIVELNDIVNSVRSTSSVSSSTSSSISKSVSVNVVKTSSGEDIFDLFNKYNRRQLCSFFQKKGLNDLEQLYISYIKNNDEVSRCAFQNRLYQYYSYNNCIDNDILELKKISSSKFGISGKVSSLKMKRKLLKSKSSSSSSSSESNSSE